MLLNDRLNADKNLFIKTGEYIIITNPAILCNIKRNFWMFSYCVMSIFFKAKSIIKAGNIKLTE